MLAMRVVPRTGSSSCAGGMKSARNRFQRVGEEGSTMNTSEYTDCALEFLRGFAVGSHNVPHVLV